MTYSVVAVDTATQEVGGAVTSCVGSLSVSIVYGSVPGHGAVHAQAQLGGPGKTGAVEQLGTDIDPTAIIAAITSPSFDSGAQTRQYGIVDVMGRSAGFTGVQTLAFADDRQGTVGSIAYSVQGNILTGAAVLDQAESSLQAQGCDLPDRLMLALEAGAQNGQGDSRCTGSGIPSDSAFIEVDRPGEPAGSYLKLDITDTSPTSPLVLLRKQFDAWRATHPCPVVPDNAPNPDAGVGMDPAGGGCCSGAGGEHAWPFVLIVGWLLWIRASRRGSPEVPGRPRRRACRPSP